MQSNDRAFLKSSGPAHTEGTGVCGTKFCFPSHLLSSPLFLPLRPSRQSGPGSHSRVFCPPLPTSVRALRFYREKTPGPFFRRRLFRGTIVNRTKILLVKIGKYIGFCVYRRSYSLWSPVIAFNCAWRHVNREDHKGARITAFVESLTCRERGRSFERVSAQSR